MTLGLGNILKGAKTNTNYTEKMRYFPTLKLTTSGIPGCSTKRMKRLAQGAGRVQKRQKPQRGPGQGL